MHKKLLAKRQKQMEVLQKTQAAAAAAAASIGAASLPDVPVSASAAEAAGASDFRLLRLKAAKMMQPVLPGEEIVIDAYTITDPAGNIAIKARLLGGERRRAEFSLIARPVMALTPATGRAVS